MAKVNGITVGKTVTVSIGNYENVRVSAEVDMSIDEGDDVDAVREKAMKSINTFISGEVDAIELKRQKASSKAGRFGVS